MQPWPLLERKIVNSFPPWCEFVASAAGSKTYERTKRSRFNQSGFLGLKVMALLNRTWAAGAMPLDERVSIHVFLLQELIDDEAEGGKTHMGAPGCPELLWKVASTC